MEAARRASRTKPLMSALHGVVKVVNAGDGAPEVAAVAVARPRALGCRGSRDQCGGLGTPNFFMRE
jgi:hypothetical protein